jgi:hypothetical protein
MALSPSQLVELFKANFSPRVVLDVGIAVEAAYRDAAQEVFDNFPGEEAHDLYPILRRSMVERNIRTKLTRHKELTLLTEQNAAANCFHTRIQAGSVILTISAVERPSEPPRAAEFRTTLAEESQLDLFSKAQQPDPESGDFLYAILLHGPLGAGILRAPAFLHVGFPDNAANSYVERINLLDHYPVLSSSVKFEIPNVERRRPKLRRKERTEGEE